MAVHDEVRAAIIMVSGDWAKHLATIKPGDREEALVVLLEQYKTVCKTLQEVHDARFPINL